MIKKTRKIFIALVFVLSIFGTFILNSPVSAREDCSTAIVGTEINENILSNEPYKEGADPTYVKFIHPTTGQEIDFENGEAVVDNSTFIFNINFEIDDTLKDCMVEDTIYTYTFQISPDYLQFTKVTSLELTHPDGEVFGVGTIQEDGTITFEFDSNIVMNKDQVKGYFQVAGKVDINETMTPGEYPLSIPTKEEFLIHVPIKSEINDIITKTGKLDSDKNATKIDWTVFVNQSYQDIEGAEVNDLIPAGLTLTDVEIYKVAFNAAGELIPGSEELVDDIDATESTIGSRTNVKIALGDIKTPYKIVYKTTIDKANDLDVEQLKFENTATLTSTNLPEKSSKDNLTADYDKFIDKTSTDYDPATNIITWQVIYNARGVSLDSGTTATDAFDSRLEYIEDSMTITKADGTTPVNFSLGEPITDNTLNITFNEAINSKLIITYQTQIKADEIIEDSETFENTFTSKGIEGEGTTTIGQGNVSKEGVISDYNNQLIDYTIIVNANKYEMNDLIIEDNYSFFGLETQSEPIIKDGDKTLSDGIDYDYTDQGIDGFKITMKGDYTSFNTTLKITFTAKYTTDNIDDNEDPEGKNNTVLRNQAKVTFKDHNNIPRTSTSTKDIEPRHEVINNGKKEGSYNSETKEITWSVYVNYNGYELNNAKIIDEITADQKLVPNSLVMKTFKVDKSNGDISVNDDSIDLTDLDKSDYDNNKVEVNLPNGTGKYVLYFKTTLEGKVVLKEHENNASFINGDKTKELKAKVTIPEGEKFVSKKAIQEGETIKWSIDINMSQSTISNATITDIPSSNTIFDKGSFKLYPYKFVDGKQVVDKDNPLVEKEDYNLSFKTKDGLESFEITFINTINKAYHLDYDSTINADEGDLRVTNKVIFNGDNNGEPTDGDSSVDFLINPKLAGGAVGVQSELKIVKYEYGTKVPIVGAHLQLIKKSNQKVVGEGYTDENGEINFSKKVNGTYILKEINAPDGYHVSDELFKGIEVNIPHKNASTNDKFEITNKANKVVFKKENVNEESIEGATFKLEVKEDGEYVAYDEKTYTSIDGGFEITKLPIGEYRLIETATVEGYILNTEPLEFEIKADENKFVEDQEFTFINYQGSVKLTKHAVDSTQNQSLLDGAIYELYKVTTGDGEDDLIDEYETEEGLINVTGLAPGDYYFIEKSSSNGYIANITPINFTINSENEGEPALIELEAFNYKASVSFNKVTKNGDPLDGVKFELQKFDSKEDTYNLIDTYTSENGLVEVKDLSPGDYRFIEVESVDGYIINTKPIEFSISESISDENELSIELGDFINYKADVEFIKYDEYQNPLAGAEFTLEKLIDDKYEKVATYTSDKDGKVVANDIAVGEYRFVETKAANGFILNTQIIEFVIPEENNNEEDSLLIILDDYVNYQGKIAIEKVDAKDKDKYLKGAEFSIYTSKNKLVENNIKAVNGKVIVEKLAPGKYYIVETKAPNGYVKTDKKFSFEIIDTFEGQPDVDTIQITNKAELPKTGTDISMIVMLLVSISSLVGLRYYYRNN